jgi:hypothetical protein
LFVCFWQIYLVSFCPTCTPGSHTAQFKGANGQAYYMNKRTGKVQAERPPNFTEQRVEEINFVSITLADGTELTTTTDENGVRRYLDFETQVCV